MLKKGKKKLHLPLGLHIGTYLCRYEVKNICKEESRNISKLSSAHIFLLWCESAAQAAVLTPVRRRRPYYCNTNTQAAALKTCRVVHSMGATMGKNGGTILDSLPSTQVSEPERYFSCFSPCDSLRVSSWGGCIYMYIYFLYTFYFSFENSHIILFVIHAAADINRSGGGGAAMAVDDLNNKYVMYTGGAFIAMYWWGFSYKLKSLIVCI